MERSQRTRTTRGSLGTERSGAERSELYSISSAKSQTSNDASLTAEERRIESAEKRFIKLKDQVANLTSVQPSKATFSTRLRSIFTSRRVRIHPVPENKMKNTIKDKDCASMRDFVMHERIPKKYAMYIDKQCYDARNLLRWLEQNEERRLPHTNVPITPEQYQKVYQKVHSSSMTSLEIIQPSKQMFRNYDVMVNPVVREDGNLIAFQNQDNQIEIWEWDVTNKKKSKRATLDISKGGVYWMGWEKNAEEFKAIIRNVGIQVQYRAWDTSTWQPKQTNVSQLLASTSANHIRVKYIVQDNFLGIISSNRTERTNVYEIWDMTTLERIISGTTNTYRNVILHIAINPLGTHVAVDFGHKVVIIEVATRNAINEIRIQQGIQSISWNSTGDRIAIQNVFFHPATRKGSTVITIFNILTGQKEFEHTTSIYPTLVWHPTKDRTFAVLHADRKQLIDIFSINSRSAKIQRIIVGAINTSTWSNQIQWIKNGNAITLCQHDRVYQWDVTGMVSGGGKKRSNPHVHPKAQKMN